MFASGWFLSISVSDESEDESDESKSDNSESESDDSDVVGECGGWGGRIFPRKTGDVLDEGGVSGRIFSASASDMSTR